MNYKDIKFRAWHKEQSKMFEVLVLDMNSGEVFLDGFTVETQYKGETQRESMWISVDEVELMMYTGQQHKHGKDIYAGHTLNSFNVADTIYWYEDHSSFYKRDKYDGESYSIESQYSNYREVIGNIYENPELV